MKFVIAKKVQMSQIFDENGNIIPVTLVEAGPCFVTQIKTKKADGYEAVQIGFKEIKKNKIQKTQKEKPFQYLREFKGDVPRFEIGDKISVSAFEPGDKVNVSGISKGKGFAGGVKRWGFKDRAKAHGAKDMKKIGSVGCRSPQRVIKGKRMPGRMGSQRITIKNLEIVKADPESNILAVKGAIPGRRGTLLEIRG